MEQETLRYIQDKQFTRDPYSRFSQAVTDDRDFEKIVTDMGISLRDIICPRLDTVDGIIRAIFYFETRYGFRPVKTEDEIAIGTKGHFIDDFLYTWHEKRSEYDNSEITASEYNSWWGSYIKG